VKAHCSIASLPHNLFVLESPLFIDRTIPVHLEITWKLNKEAL
jgi:hypothetical protein